MDIPAETLLRWAEYSHATVKLLVWLAGQAAANGGWTPPLSKRAIFEGAGLSRGTKNQRVMLPILEAEFETGATIGGKACYRLATGVPSTPQVQPERETDVPSTPVSRPAQPAPSTYSVRRSEPICVPSTPLSARQRTQYAKLPHVCMYADSPDPQPEETYIHPTPPADHDYWSEKRSLALLALAGWSGQNPSAEMRRWACERAMQINGVSRPVAKKLAYSLDLEKLEAAIDYWIYLRVKGIKVPLPDGGRDVPRPGWLIGHLKHDYGVNHGYTARWRWPELALCPDCGQEHTNGDGHLCDGCSAAAQQPADPEPERNEPQPADWWPDSLRAELGNMPVIDAWYSTLGQLELQMNSSDYRFRVAPLVPLYYADGELVLGCTDDRQRDWLVRKGVKDTIERVLQDRLQTEITVRLEEFVAIAA